MAIPHDDDGERTVVSDRDGIICHWGSQWESTLGYTGEEAIGQKVDLFIPPVLRAMHWAGFNKAIENGNLRQHPTTPEVTAVQDSGATISIAATLKITRPAIHKSGELVPILATLVLRRGTDGTPVGVVGTMFGRAPGWAGIPWRVVLPLLRLGQSLWGMAAGARRTQGAGGRGS